MAATGLATGMAAGATGATGMLGMAAGAAGAGRAAAGVQGPLARPRFGRCVFGVRRAQRAEGVGAPRASEDMAVAWTSAASSADGRADEVLEERAMLKGELMRACAPTDRGQRAGSYRRSLVCSLVEGLEEGWSAAGSAPEARRMLAGTWELLFAATQGGQGDAHVFRSSPVFGSVGVALGEEASGQLFDATWALKAPLGADFGEVTQQLDVERGELTSRVCMSVAGGVFAGTVVTVADVADIAATWPTLHVTSRTTAVEPTGVLAPLAPVFSQVTVPVGTLLSAPAEVALTYLDDDLRVARQAGALFVYTKSF